MAEPAPPPERPAVGRRRLGAHAEPTPSPDGDGRYVFTRPRGRVVADLVLAPLGAVIFLGVAVFLVSQVFTNPMLAIGGLVFGFFGLLMAAGSMVTFRRGTSSTMLEISPSGIFAVDLGFQPWSAIREVRLERSGVGGRRRSAASAYQRLGIYPRDPELLASAPGGLARRLTGAFFGFVKLMQPSAQVPAIEATAPYGVAAYELAQPLDALVPLIGSYVPVFDADGRLLVGPVVAAPEAAEPPPAVSRPLDPLVAAIPALATAVTAPVLSGGGLGVGLVADQPAAAPARAVYRKRSGTAGATGDVMRAGGFIVMPVAISMVFVVVGFGTPSALGLVFGLFPVVLAAAFVAAGMPALLEALGRLRVAQGPEEALVVDEAGIAMTGMGRLSWPEIAEIRIGEVNMVEQGEGSHPDRPRLEIVPRDASRLEARPWAARTQDQLSASWRARKPWGDRKPRAAAFALGLDQLDAVPDDVIDQIARYHVVLEED